MNSGLTSLFRPLTSSANQLTDRQKAQATLALHGTQEARHTKTREVNRRKQSTAMGKVVSSRQRATAALQVPKSRKG